MYARIVTFRLDRDITAGRVNDRAQSTTPALRDLPGFYVHLPDTAQRVLRPQPRQSALRIVR